MTIAGLGLILFIVLQIVSQSSFERKLSKYCLMLLFFELFANVGKIGNLGGVELQYSDIIWLILFAYSIHYLYVRGLERREWIKVMALFGGLFLCVTAEILNMNLFGGFNIRSLLIFVRIMMMMFVYKTLLINFSVTEIRYLSDVFLKMQNIIYVVIVIEFFIKNIFHSNIYNGMIGEIFGVSENQVTWLLQRGGLNALQGLCKEPSHFAIFLLFASLYDIWIQKNYRKGEIYFFINCALLLVSGSFSSLVYIVVLFLAYIIYLHVTNKMMIIGMIAILSASIVIVVGDKVQLLSYYAGRFANVFRIITGVVSGYTSEGVRLGGIFESFKQFGEHPLFGIGIGNNVKTGAVSAFLSSIGIVGIIPFFTSLIYVKSGIFPLILVLCASLFTMDMGIYYSISFSLLMVLYQFNMDKISDHRPRQLLDL